MPAARGIILWFRAHVGGDEMADGEEPDAGTPQVPDGPPSDRVVWYADRLSDPRGDLTANERLRPSGATGPYGPYSFAEPARNYASGGRIFKDFSTLGGTLLRRE